MDYHRKGNFVPVTCTYWRNSHCFKGERCTFVHGFICRDDGICSDPLCNKNHYKQRDPSSYLKVRGRNGSRHRYRSKSRSPYRRSRTPYSPKRRQLTPKRRSRSPRRSYSPRRSASPRRSWSNSPRRSYSPYKKSQKSESRSRSRSHSRSPSHGRSHIKNSWKKSPPRKRGGVSPGNDRDDSSSPPNSEDEIERSMRTRGSVERSEGQGDVLVIKEDKTDLFYDPMEEKEPVVKSTSKSKFKPIGEKESFTSQLESSRTQDSPGSSNLDVSPSSRAFEILKSLPQNFFSPGKDEEKAREQKDAEREKRKGEKESFKSAVEQDSFREAFLKALNKSGGSSKSAKGEGQEDPLPPVLKHPLNAESLAKPFQEKLYGYDQSHAANPGSNLWTPALDRSKLPQSSSSVSGQSISNWEIDTPYVGRNNRELPARSLSAGNKMLAPPGANIPPVEEPKKKKKKRRHRSSSSSSSSSDEESAEKKKSESEELALEKKKKILSKVWTLMEQKKKLEAQRDDVVLNHKGDGKSLATLLKENSILSSEIDRQIFVMNQMVQSINDKLGMSKLEAQQQEFFFQPSMYKDSKFHQAPKKSILAAEKNLEKSISKFLKPPEDSVKKSTPPSPPPKRSKKSIKSRSRSKSHDRKRSTSPPEKKSVKKHSCEKRVKKEKTPPVVEEVKPKKKKDAKKSLSASSKTKSHSKPTGEVEYAPSPAMKPHIKYIDQGMHWCKICNDFLDTVQDYVQHLETGAHLENLRNDAKPWLPKAPKIEKDPVDPNAPVLTIPFQGLEFINSMTAFYCCLCDAFIKTNEEARTHSETKLHVSKYKEHLSKNPMYETMYVRDKMAAFAKYSLDKERRKEKNPSLDNLKSQVFFCEVKNKTDENIPRLQPSSSPPPESKSSLPGSKSPPSEGRSSLKSTSQTSKPKLQPPKPDSTHSKSYSHTPKPNAQVSKPDSQPPNPNSQPPKPNSQPPKPNSQPPKPNSQPPKPHSQPPKPHSQPPKPNSQPPKPHSQPPKPHSQPPKPNSQPPKPNSQPPKPNSQPPKPNSQPPKPNSQPPKPNSQPPKPNSQPPQSTSPKLPPSDMSSPKMPTNLPLRPPETPPNLPPASLSVSHSPLHAPPSPPSLPPPPLPPKLDGQFISGKDYTFSEVVPVSQSVEHLGAGSIRVASRSSVSSSNAGSEEKHEKVPLSNSNLKSPETKDVDPNPITGREGSPDRETSKSSSELDNKSKVSQIDGAKLDSLKNKISESKGKNVMIPPSDKEQNASKDETTKLNSNDDSNEKISKSSFSQNDVPSHTTSKLHIKKYSNVIIGKMPFLKKTSRVVPPSTKNSTEEPKVQPEASSISEAEKRIRQMLSEGLPQAAPKEETTISLPPTVPRNLEYITEIESSGKGTTFTKMFGPTLQRPDDLSEESQEAAMDISHDETSSEDESPKKEEPQQHLEDIPVPVDIGVVDAPSKFKGLTPPFESKLKVDMSNPHLSQLSAAAAMYKEAIAYQPLPMPPTPFLQLPPVPPMLNPMFPPFNPVPPPTDTEPFIEGLNPPPPGTEEGSSNPSSGNVHSDGGDSPDSLLCQKTPPPPGTEDEAVKRSSPPPPRFSEVSTTKSEEPDVFKNMLADVPVLSYGSSSNLPEDATKDEGSQESLVQEGLELLEFADEDEKEKESSVNEEPDMKIQDKSPPLTRSKRKAAVLAQEAMKAKTKNS